MRVEIGDLRRVVQAARQERPPGGPWRPLPRRLDHDCLRHVGLPWHAGAQGLSGLVYVDGGSSPTPMTRERGRAGARGPAGPGSPWLAFGGIPAPFAGLFATGGAGPALIDPNGPALGAVVSAAAGQSETAGPGHQPRPVGLRIRHRDLASKRRRLPSSRRAPGGQRRPTRLEPGGRDHPDRAVREDVLRDLGRGRRRRRLVSPAAPDDRRGSGGRGQPEFRPAGPPRQRCPRRSDRRPDLRVRRLPRGRARSRRGSGAGSAVGSACQRS